MEKVPEALAHARVLDPEGGGHRLMEAWKKKPVVLVFLRHYG